MLSFGLNFNKLEGIRCRPCVRTDYCFTWIMEKVLYCSSVMFQYNQGNAKLVASNFVISTEDLCNLVYEIDVKALKPKEITLSFELAELLKVGEELRVLMDKYQEIDIKSFVAYCRGKQQSEDEELLSAVFGEEENIDVPKPVEVYLKGDILRIEAYAPAESQQDEEEKKETKSNIIPFPLDDSPSALRGVIIANKLFIPVHEKVFWKVIQNLERMHMEYEVKTVINHIVGHCIEFENLSISGSGFELVFNEQRLIEAHFGAFIADTSYFTTTKGKKHNIGQIVSKELNGKEFVQVEGYGADDAWHYAADDSYTYVYRLGYNL